MSLVFHWTYYSSFSSFSCSYEIFSFDHLWHLHYNHCKQTCEYLGPVASLDKLPSYGNITYPGGSRIYSAPNHISQKIGKRWGSTWKTAHSDINPILLFVSVPILFTLFYSLSLCLPSLHPSQGPQSVKHSRREDTSRKDKKTWAKPWYF